MAAVTLSVPQADLQPTSPTGEGGPEGDVQTHWLKVTDAGGNVFWIPVYT